MSRVVRLAWLLASIHDADFLRREDGGVGRGPRQAATSGGRKERSRAHAKGPDRESAGGGGGGVLTWFISSTRAIHAQERPKGSAASVMVAFRPNWPSPTSKHGP
jgi:hypothetical protein